MSNHRPKVHSPHHRTPSGIGAVSADRYRKRAGYDSSGSADSEAHSKRSQPQRSSRSTDAAPLDRIADVNNKQDLAGWKHSCRTIEPPQAR